MKMISLFSGIGAFEKAFDKLKIDYELVNYCEIDKYASKSYSMMHNIPEAKNLWDITKIDMEKLPKVDLVTYGFPCQDISLAGKLKGFEDEEGNLTRSGLFFYAADVIKHTRPKIAIFENVKNLTGKKFKKEFDIVLNTLDELGYNTYWKVLNSKDFGIPQNRERVFGVSIRKDVDKGFEFPQGFELGLRLKDLLEENVDEKYYLSKSMVNYISSSNEKWTGNNDKSLINKSVASTINTGEGSRRCDASNYICDDLPEDYDLKLMQPKILQVGSVDIGNNESNNRVYSPNGLSPTLNTMQGGHRQPKVLVKEATKKGYAEATVGDSINLEQPNSKTRRGRVGKGVAQTLTTGCNQAVIEPLICASRGRNLENPNSSKAGEPTEQRIEINYSGCSNTLTTVQKDNYVLEPTYRIRKLTPRECWRLMGFSDEDFDKVKGVSNTQLYKQAGNSIVVNVLEYLFENMRDYLEEE